MRQVQDISGPAKSQNRDRKRIVLLNPPYFRSMYPGLRGPLFHHYLPSLTLAVLAAPLLNRDHDVKAIDAVEVDRSFRRSLSGIVDFNPDVLAFTFTTPIFPSAASLAEQLRASLPRARFLCGGYHASALPGEILNGGAFDGVVVGEGEKSLTSYVEQESPESVPGLVYRNRMGSITRNRPSDLIRDLDSLPIPAWSLFDLHRFRYNTLYHKRTPIFPMETTRGCPYACSFCSKEVYGRTFRHKSPERVLDEIKTASSLGAGEIYLVDDSFLTEPKRARAICDALVVEDLAMPWSCHARVDEVDTDLLASMKRAGCHTIAYGIESLSREVLQGAGKPLPLETVREAIALTRRHGIRAWGCFVLGLPHETDGSLRESVDSAVALDLDFAKWSVAVPFPGTPLFKEWSDEGRIKSADWGKFKLHGRPQDIYDHPNLDSRLIGKYYRKAYMKFYLRPGYWKGFFARLREWKRLPSQSLGRQSDRGTAER